ncbi:MAG: hypothetical protein V1676_05765 [Candidatus Diapherotrites archaeon]
MKQTKKEAEMALVSKRLKKEKDEMKRNGVKYLSEDEALSKYMRAVAPRSATK